MRPYSEAVCVEASRIYLAEYESLFQFVMKVLA